LHIVSMGMIIDARAVKEATNFLESNETIGAVQVIIVRLDARDGEVDSARMIVDESHNRLNYFENKIQARS